jgi:oligosaccharide repeat unit polymerase
MHSRWPGKRTKERVEMMYVFAACCGATVLSASYYNKDIFSPLRVFICIYAFLLAVNSLHLSGHQTPWALTTHLFFWGATCCFIAGAGLMLLVNRVCNPCAAFDFGSIRNGIRSDSRAMDWTWFFGVWVLCTAVFLSSYTASYLISGGIPMFATGPNADTARGAFFGASLPTNIGLFFGPISLILATELLLFGTLLKKRRRAVMTVAIVTAALYVTVVTRLDLFRVVLFIIVIYHYGVKRLSLVQLGYVLGFSVLFFFLFSLFSVHYDTLGFWAETQKLHMPKEFIWCANIYSYVVNNFWNFDFGVQKFVDGNGYYPHGWGFDLMRPFLFLSHLEGGLEASYGFDSIMNESVVKVAGLNTVIYIWHFFKDFGAFGVYFLPLVGGMISTVFYINTVNSPTLFRAALWAMVVPCIILSYHAPLWELWFVYINLLVLAIAHRRLALAT